MVEFFIRRPIFATVLAMLMLLIGGLWTLQGLGMVGGSFMTGSRLWLVIGLIVAIAGIALLISRRRPVR